MFKERLAILHHHYQSISQYLERINRYSEVQAQELIKKNYQIRWQDLINKPKNEFLSRFFAGEGYKDGMHGLVLALLQSFFRTNYLFKGLGKTKTSKKKNLIIWMKNLKKLVRI